MKKTNTISALALSRLRFQKSRTLLTGIAIMLTTMLLMAIGTIGVATLDMNRQMVSEDDYHAIFDAMTSDQANVLSKHIHVEAMSTMEVFADIVNGKMNGALAYRENIKDERSADGTSSFGMWEIESGHYPETEDEICSSPAFFRRVGADPVIGGKVTLSFRINGKGEVLTKDFTISGLFPDVEIDTGIDDSRIMWAAMVSKALLDQYREAGLYQPTLDAYLRVHGESELSYGEITDRINTIATDIGLNTEDVILNKEYLFTMTDPDTDVIAVVAAISLIVIVFSALVIYSIYYVGVITDVQEIGKLKAIGASGRQLAKLFYCQGMIVSAFAIPLGLLAGFLLPYFLFPLVIQAAAASTINSNARDMVESLHVKYQMFSLPVLLLVTAAVLITVWLSLLKPIRMAKKVSPVEAIRYQENTGSAKTRKGHRTVKVSTLTFANLIRNKRRTAVTLLTMGLSCVLFICVSAVLSSASAEDLARRNIPEGDFRIALDYDLNDKEYPENNLDSLVQQNYFNDVFLTQLSSIEGVKTVKRAYGKISSLSDYAMYRDLGGEPTRISFSYFTREDLPELNRNLIQGSIDYDRMTTNREVLCTDEYTFKKCRLAIGDSFSLTLYDGDREIPLDVTLSALTQPDSDYTSLVVTEDTWKELGLTYDPTTDIYLEVDEEQYERVKDALTDIVAQNEHFTLYAMDVEMKIGRASLGMVIYPFYLLLILIAVIGFISLINTMITSIITRKKELGILQSIGLSGRQLVNMLAGEGLVFTAGTLLISLTLGNGFGYLLFRYAKENHFMSISRYHYPLWESIGLAVVLLGGQLLITLLIRKKMEKESLIDRIRNQD